MPEGRVGEEHRRVVAERAGGCCEYCRSQARFSSDSFSIVKLALNRAAVVNLRRVLRATGEHPPVCP